MSYTQYNMHVWEKGDLISAIKLNELENGIITASNALNLLGESVTYGLIDNTTASGIDTWLVHAELNRETNDTRLITARAIYNACGTPNGIATLDNAGLIPASQLPTLVDDILEGFYNVTDGHFYKNRLGTEGSYTYQNLYYGGKTHQDGTEDQTTFGEFGKIYVDVGTLYTYRWNGTEFVEITSENRYARKTNTDLLGTLHVVGNTTMDANLTVTGTSTLNDNVVIATNKTLTVGGTTTLNDTLTVNGASQLNDNVAIAANKTLSVGGAADFDATLNVDGNATFGAQVTVTGALSINNNTTITNGTLQVSGSTTLNNTLTVNGVITANENVEIVNTKDLKVKKGSIILGDTSTANNTIYAIASASQLGCFKVGADLAIDANGVLSGNYGIADSYNSSTNQLATVATVTNAVNALDVSNITGFGTDKTLSALTETDGKIAASFQSIQITESQVTNLTDDLASKAAKATQISAGSGLTGGGTLEADRTISHSVPTGASTSNNKTAVANTFINAISFDEFGHVVGVGTGTETVYTHPTPASLGGAQTSGLYNITVDADGHVTGVSAVTKSDILEILGVSETDFDAIFPNE